MSKMQALDNYNSGAGSEILNRVKAFYSIATDRKLAEFLDVSPGTLSSWRSRGGINLFDVVGSCKGVNLHWLITGDGPKELPGVWDSVLHASEPQGEYLSKKQLLQEKVDMLEARLKDKEEIIEQMRKRLGETK